MRRRDLLKGLFAAPLVAACGDLRTGQNLNPHTLKLANGSEIAWDLGGEDRTVVALHGPEMEVVSMSEWEYPGVWPRSRFDSPEIREAQRAYTRMINAYIDMLYRGQGLVIYG